MKYANPVAATITFAFLVLAGCTDEPTRSPSGGGTNTTNPNGIYEDTVTGGSVSMTTDSGIAIHRLSADTAQLIAADGIVVDTAVGTVLNARADSGIVIHEAAVENIDLVATDGIVVRSIEADSLVARSDSGIVIQEIRSDYVSLNGDNGVVVRTLIGATVLLEAGVGIVVDSIHAQTLSLVLASTQTTVAITGTVGSCVLNGGYTYSMLRNLECPEVTVTTR